MKRTLAALARAKVDEIGRKATSPLGEGGDAKIPDTAAALTTLRKWAAGKDGRPYVAALVDDELSRLYNEWLRERADDERRRKPRGDVEQLALEILGDVPLRWETSPGRFADFVECNTEQIDAALRQAKVKMDNATGYYLSLKAAADRVRPHMTTPATLVKEALRALQAPPRPPSPADVAALVNGRPTP